MGGKASLDELANRQTTDPQTEHKVEVDACSLRRKRASAITRVGAEGTSYISVRIQAKQDGIYTAFFLFFLYSFWEEDIEPSCRRQSPAVKVT